MYLFLSPPRIASLSLILSFPSLSLVAYSCSICSLICLSKKISAVDVVLTISSRLELDVVELLSLQCCFVLSFHLYLLLLICYYDFLLLCFLFFFKSLIVFSYVLLSITMVFGVWIVYQTITSSSESVSLSDV